MLICCSFYEDIALETVRIAGRRGACLLERGSIIASFVFVSVRFAIFDMIENEYIGYSELKFIMLFPKCSNVLPGINPFPYPMLYLFLNPDFFSSLTLPSSYSPSLPTYDRKRFLDLYI